MICRLAVVIIFLFGSCQPLQKQKPDFDYSDFIERNIFLVGYNKEFKQTDTFAAFTISLPERLDTFYQWTDWSDCTACGNAKYRFSDKKYKQFKEGGFYWTYKPDSVYQLSIWHKPYKETPDTVAIRPLIGLGSAPRNWFEPLIHCNTFEYRFKKFEVINNRTFYLNAFSSPCGFLTDSATLYLTATTNLNRRHLYIVAECSARDTTGFLDKMYKAIHTIDIREKDETKN